MHWIIHLDTIFKWVQITIRHHQSLFSEIHKYTSFRAFFQTLVLDSELLFFSSLYPLKKEHYQKCSLMKTIHWYGVKMGLHGYCRRGRKNTTGVCVWSQITLPLSLSLCCARDVGADRSGWKMWSLLPSSSFSSSPTTSLKIAGRKRRQQSRGSICWAASGFITPTTSKRERVLWIASLILILITSEEYYLISCFSQHIIFYLIHFKLFCSWYCCIVDIR